MIAHFEHLFLRQVAIRKPPKNVINYILEPDGLSESWHCFINMVMRGWMKIHVNVVSLIP